MKQKAVLDPIKADALQQLAGDGEVDPNADVEAEADELLTGGVTTLDESVLDELGQAFGVSYDSTEELFCGEKEFEGDRHRWELDPASSEDYLDRCRLSRGAWRWRHFNH